MSNYPGALSGGFVSHRFVSLKPDQPDPSLINATQWNQSHIIGSGAIQSGAMGSASVLWNPNLTGKPLITVTPNGPTDGGDYGPNTSGTKTGGVQEAINSIALNGGTVYIRNGTYSLTVPIALANNHIRIVGENPDATILQSVASMAAVITGLTTSLSDISIESLTLDAHSQSATMNLDFHGTNLTYTDVFLVRLVLKGSTQTLYTQILAASNLWCLYCHAVNQGIGRFSGKYVYTIGCKVENSTSIGIIYNDVVYGLIADNIVLGWGSNVSFANAGAIDIGPSTYVDIKDNILVPQGNPRETGGIVLDNCSGGFDIAGNVFDGTLVAISGPLAIGGNGLGSGNNQLSKTAVSPINIHDNLFYGNGINATTGVYLNLSSLCTNHPEFKVVGNMFANGGTSAVSITGTSSTVYPIVWVNDNIMDSAKANGTTYGIYLSNCDVASLSRNSLTAASVGPANYGVYVVGAVNRLIMKDNYVSGYSLLNYSLGTLPTIIVRSENYNYNPLGLLTAPAVSTSQTINNFGVRVTVYVTVGGTTTSISKNQTGVGNFVNGVYPVDLGIGEMISLSQTTGVTWQWWGF